MKTTQEIRDIIGLVTYRDWRFEMDEEPLSVRVLFTARDIVSGEPSEQSSRKLLLSKHMTDGEIIQTCLLAVKTALEHEMREEFLWKGEAIFGPHFDIHALHALCTEGNLVYRS